MNLEEQNQICSNSSRSSKKQKQKKIPQRGLGVAQLEKIRIEEQQKKIGANSIFTYPNLVSPTNSSSFPVPFYNCPSSLSPPSVPFTSPSPTSISPSQSPILMPIDENLYLNSVPLPPLNHLNIGGFDVGWQSIPTVDGNGHLHKMWHPYELNHEGENSRWDHGLPNFSNVSLPFESSPIMPLSDIMPRPPQFSQASASNSLMNIPLMSSPVISNFQMEPPSNQSLYSNFSSLWPEKDKMASTKRPYPFPLDMPTLPSFHSKIPRIASALDESTSFGNGSFFNADHAVPIFQETPLMPSSSTSETPPKKTKKENENQHGDFLTLAPPSVTSSHPSPRLRHSLTHRNAEEMVANSPTSAGSKHRFAENLALNSGPRLAGLNHQNPFFTFIPDSKVQQESSATNKHSNPNGNGEVGDIIDLNLKL